MTWLDLLSMTAAGLIGMLLGYVIGRAATRRHINALMDEESDRLYRRLLKIRKAGEN